MNEKTVPPTSRLAATVEMINNLIFLAAAYEQIWTVTSYTEGNQIVAAIIDERSGETKIIFSNPDEAMCEFIEALHQQGWYSLRREFLIDGDGFYESRVRLIEAD